MTWWHWAACAAATLVFVRGSLFARVRESGPALWRELASCALCAGVWVGMLCHAALVSDAGAWSLWEAVRAVGWGALVGAGALALVRVLDALDKGPVD